MLFWQPELTKTNGLVVVMCFQLPDISTKTSSPLKDMKTVMTQGFPVHAQTCSHGFDVFIPRSIVIVILV